MRNIRMIAGIAGTSLAAGCATATQSYNPFVGGPGGIAPVRTVALLSADLPTKLLDRETIAQQFDSALTAGLRSAGYTVIPRAQVDPLWHSLADTAKLFDARTGQSDSVTSLALRRAMAREVKQRFGADAWLLPGFYVRTARYESGWCHWDGAKQYVQSKGELLKMALLSRTKSGKVPALSARVAIIDSTGRSVYVNYGGVSALVRVTTKGIEDIGSEQAFADAERNVNAVRLALEPLVKNRP